MRIGIVSGRAGLALIAAALGGMAACPAVDASAGGCAGIAEDARTGCPAPGGGAAVVALTAAAVPLIPEGAGPRPLSEAGQAVASDAEPDAIAGQSASAAPPQPGAQGGPVVQFVGSYVWRESGADFGGFSGLEVSDDGRRYTALSDQSTLRWGTILRNPGGGIRGLTTAGTARLKDSRGNPLKPGYLGDSEGLAIDDQGRLFVSFEGLNRIARYDDIDAPATRLAGAKGFAALRKNVGLEALAITPGGDVLTIPENWSAKAGSFPVWRLRDGRWDRPWTIRRDGSWAPVGADVGPDGKLYLLERDFRGVQGFANRVRRFEMTDTALLHEEVLLETAFLQYDNLEGLAVWQDGLDIRLTMISDDNFLLWQRTELVEYRVRD